MWQPWNAPVCLIQHCQRNNPLIRRENMPKCWHAAVCVGHIPRHNEKNNSYKGTQWDVPNLCCYSARNSGRKRWGIIWNGTSTSTSRTPVLHFPMLSPPESRVWGITGKTEHWGHPHLSHWRHPRRQGVVLEVPPWYSFHQMNSKELKGSEKWYHKPLAAGESFLSVVLPFSCCWGQTSGQSNVIKRKFHFGSQFEGAFHHGREGRWSHCVHSQQAERGEHWWLAHIILFIQSGT